MDQKITEQDARIRALEETIKSMVPAAVHNEREKRYELQNEFDKFRLEQLEKEMGNWRSKK